MFQYEQFALKFFDIKQTICNVHCNNYVITKLLMHLIIWLLCFGPC